ncbi:MAG TPA: hypothetical protein VGX03_28910 [Candidatus Binatia bacterium]|nr:hypothetical protein [Candidatus Binatia bacterium]
MAYGERAREIAAELAMHFERGRDYQRAVRYLERAGKNAIRRSTHAEATLLLTKGLELLKLLPDTPEQLQQEIRLQLALGWALMATKGFAAPEVATAFFRARELCRQVEDPHLLFSALNGEATFYMGRAELRTARDLAEQLLALAQHVQNHLFLQIAHQRLGEILYNLGELAPARFHLEQGIALCNSHPDRSLTLPVTDSGVNCLVIVALVLCALGYPDQARQRSSEALRLAEALSYPPSQACAMACAIPLHLYRQEWQTAQEQAEALLTFSLEYGFPLRVAQGTINRGYVLVEQGYTEEGSAQIREGLATYEATGAKQDWPGYLSGLAWAYGKMGRTDEGVAMLTEALEVVHKTGQRLYETELSWLKGELTLQKFQVSGSKFHVPNPQAEAEAEAYFLKAIDIARQQQAKSLELRAVTSLSRLWRQRGKAKEAHKMLAEIYGWFTEGFDTKDLQEAKALLEELG